MALAETANLVVLLSLRDNLSAGLKTANAEIARLNKTGNATGASTTRIAGGMTTASRAATVFGTALGNVKRGLGGLLSGPLGFLGLGAGILGFTKIMHTAIESTKELQVVQAQTAAVLKSTGGAAGIGAEGIRSQAEALENLTTVDDKTIQAGENLLLTFTNIRNQAGAGNDIFNQTTKATLDMAIAMNKGNVEGADLKGTAIQLGKALNDPVKGYTALKRVGVTFSEEQIKQIKNFVKTNNLLGAQKVILAEVSREFGGSAAAAANTYAGQQARLADSVEDLEIAFGTALIPGLTRVSKALADAFRDPGTVRAVTEIGTAIGDLFSPANIQAAGQLIGTFKQVFGAIRSGWNAIPPEVRQLLLVGFAANKAVKFTFGVDLLGAGKGLFQQFLGRGSSAANALWVQSVGGVGSTVLPGQKGGGIQTALGLLSKILIVGMVAEFADLIKPTIDQAGRDANKAIFGEGGGPLAPVGQFLDDLEWPFGSKNTPLIDIGPIKDILGGRHQVVDAPVLSDPASALAAGAGTMSYLAGERGQAGASAIVDKLAIIHADLIANLAILKTSSTPAAVAAAASFIARDVKGGAGSLATTNTILADLKAKLATTTDPAARSALEAAIKTVGAKIPGREWVARQLQQGERIVGSNKTTAQKIAELKAIQAQLLRKSDTVAAAKIAAAIAALIPHIDAVAVAAAMAAGQQTVNYINSEDPRKTPVLGPPLPSATITPIGPRTPKPGRGSVPGGITVVVPVKVSPSGRQNQSANAATTAYGPSAVSSGAAVVIVG